MGRTKNLTPAQKLEIVLGVLSERLTSDEACRAHGITESTLASWRADALKGMLAGLGDDDRAAGREEPELVRKNAPPPARVAPSGIVERHWTWFRAALIPLIVLAWAGVLVGLWWVLGHLTHALLVLVLSSLVAFALTPLVNLLNRWLPRALAISIAYVMGLLVILGLVGIVAISAASEISNLVQNLPAYGERAKGLEPQVAGMLAPLGVQEAQLAEYRARAIVYLQTVGTHAVQDAVGAVQLVLGAIVDAILVLILSIYLTANGPAIGRWLRHQTPGGQRHRTRELIAIVNQVVGGYIRGTFAMATLVGVLVGAGMFALHVRYALLLGVIAFFMEFVPILGVFISGALCVAIALFQGWLVALLVAIYFAVVHVIEGDLVGPRVMGKSVGVHPAVALLALVAGSELFGLWGALFGAPLAGLLQAIGTAVWREVRIASPAFADSDRAVVRSPRRPAKEPGRSSAPKRPK
jgi:predicted PurR-regulated permease PerM/transposase-like protein